MLWLNREVIKDVSVTIVPLSDELKKVSETKETRKKKQSIFIHIFLFTRSKKGVIQTTKICIQVEELYRRISSNKTKVIINE